jgi:hypothetical protein
MPSGRTGMRARLDPPGLISQNEIVDNTGVNGNERTLQQPLAPNIEIRIMLADRVRDVFTPQNVSYANQDPQKGGAPGSPGAAPGGTDPESATNFITSQSSTGDTTPGGAPDSPRKLSYGESDWAAEYPTWLPAHGKIGIRQNPNAAQTNVGLWANEGQPSNTKYASPAPWASGTFIG